MDLYFTVFFIVFVKEKPYRISFYLGYKVVLRGKKISKLNVITSKYCFFYTYYIFYCIVLSLYVCMHVCMHVSVYISSDGTQHFAYSRQTLYYFAMLPALLQILLFFMLYIKSFKLSPEDDMT